MSARPISEAKSADLRGSLAAMQRAAELARETAIRTGGKQLDWIIEGTHTF